MTRYLSFSPRPCAALFLCGATALGGASARAATIVSTSHPNAVYYNFNSGPVPFETFSVPGGVPSGARFALDNGALKITNAFAGSFSVDTKLKPYNAEELGHIYFDYKLSPDVKVNFFFSIPDVDATDKYYGVIFTGPDAVRPGSIKLGKIEGIKADGQWHRAHIPLRDWLREVNPLATTFDVNSVVIGNWDNSNWLMAGMGGNGPGATWWLDNFVITGVGPGEAKLELRDEPGGAPAAQWMLNGQKIGDGSKVTATVPDGFHMIEARDAAGKVLAGYPLYAAPSAPKIGAAQLAGNTLKVAINAPGGLKLDNLKLTVEGREFARNSVFLKWDGDTGQLLLDAGRAGFQWKDGASVPVSLSGVTDMQNRQAPAWQGNVPVNFAAHKVAPVLPRVQIAGTEPPRAQPTTRDADTPLPTVPAPIFGAGDGTFEEGRDEWMSIEKYDAVIDRDDSTAASGKYSLRLWCPANAARFWANIRTSGFDAAKVPVVSFDYKISPQLRADFMVLFEGKTYSINFTDKDNPALRIGSVPNVTADNQWHHAEINLGAMLRDAAPGRSSYRVDSFYIGDGGWLGNARGVQYWFDNFQFVPLVTSPLKATVALPDVTGLKATAWVLDEKPDTEPATTANGGGVIETSGSGRRWLHVRAQNGAGQWTPTLHLPVWLSEGAPVVAKNDIVPAIGARAVPTALEIPLRAEGGVEPGSIKLTLAGRDYTVQDAALRYDKDAHKLTWDAAEALAAGHIEPMAEGTRVAWKLSPVRDFLGNEAPGLEGDWTIDPAQDKSGPRVRAVSETHAPYLYEDFEDDAGWTGEGAKITSVERAGGGRALRITNAGDGAPFVLAARLPDAPLWDSTRANLIRFDYKIPPEANLALRLKFSNGRSWYLSLAGEKIERSLGTVPGIIADNQWRTAALKISDFLERDRTLRSSSVTGLEIRDAAMKTADGVAWEIDNFIVQQAGGSKVKLSWRAHDLSNVKKYRVAWDQKTDTVPTEETAETTREFEGAPGLWFAHVQAQDGAGNWGPVLHQPILADTEGILNRENK